MKSLKYIYHVLLAIMVTSTFLMSCEDDDGVFSEKPKGTPTSGTFGLPILSPLILCS
jgi:hypothetical protein